MKTITLTPQEYTNFKSLVKRGFEAFVKGGYVHVTCSTLILNQFGYEN